MIKIVGVAFQYSLGYCTTDDYQRLMIEPMGMRTIEGKSGPADTSGTNALYAIHKGHKSIGLLLKGKM